MEEDQPLPAFVAALVESIDGRSKSQTDLAVQVLARRSWPGGTADRNTPAAAEWVRRWGPSAADTSYLDGCSCSAGRCVVCN